MKFANCCASVQLLCYDALEKQKWFRMAVPNLTMVAANAILWWTYSVLLTRMKTCVNLESLEKADNIDALMYVPLNGKSGNALEIKKILQRKKYFLLKIQPTL